MSHPFGPFSVVRRKRDEAVQMRQKASNDAKMCAIIDLALKKGRKFGWALGFCFIYSMSVLYLLCCIRNIRHMALLAANVYFKKKLIIGKKRSLVVVRLTSCTRRKSGWTKKAGWGEPCVSSLFK